MKKKVLAGRALAILLSFVMCMSLVPITSLAEGTVTDKKTTSVSTGNITYELGKAYRFFVCAKGDGSVYRDGAKSVPIYRQYNPNAYACNHNYTKSKAENDKIVGLGWKYEGIGWYGVK